MCHSNDWSFRCINFWWIQIVILDEGIWQIRSSASIGWIAHTFLFPSVSPHRLYNRITTLPPAAKNASCTHWIKLTNKEHQEPPSLKYSLHHAFSLEWCDFGFWCQSNQPSQFPLFAILGPLLMLILCDVFMIWCVDIGRRLIEDLSTQMSESIVPWTRVGKWWKRGRNGSKITVWAIFKIVTLTKALYPMVFAFFTHNVSNTTSVSFAFTVMFGFKKSLFRHDFVSRVLSSSLIHPCIWSFSQWWPT